MRRRVALGAVVLVLAGCAGPVAGVPAPAGAPPAPAAPFTPGPGVPRVARPRDARHIAACDLLTPAQLEGFGVDLATARSSEQNTGLRCEWRARNKLVRFEAVVAAGLGPSGFIPGLSQLYFQRDTYDIFEPGELDGFPIVHADRDVNSDCTIYVGNADDQVVYTAAGSATGDPKRCDIARAMASALLSNLPPLR